jgi:hypothetical protein
MYHVFAQKSNSSLSLSADSSTNQTQFLKYIDEDLGFSIGYPSDWSITTTNLPANEIVVFSSPDADANVEVKFFSKKNGETLRSFGNDLKQGKEFKILGFYRNETTTLAGLPAIRLTGLYFNQVNTFESELGYTSKTDKILMIWTLSKTHDGFFGVMYWTDKSLFPKYHDSVEQIIKSFELQNFKPIVQED